ncbi:hypothetical protein NBRC116495_33600 [Aurantivibrio plasticivorans]
MWINISLAIYIYFSFQRKIAKAIEGVEYYSAGLILSIFKLPMYGHYCLFPKRARRDGVDNVFQSLSTPQKVMLTTHWVTLSSSVLLIVLAQAF